MPHALNDDISDPFLDSDDSEPTIVDCAVLEAAKENIQPLARGRRATSLAAVLATPHGQRDARLNATRARLRARVEEALEAQARRVQRESAVVDEDEEDEEDEYEVIERPLEAYVRFVDWTIEHYPAGHSAESGILELLEEATRVLKDDPECRSDARYLRMWVQYAGYVDRPALVYAFCLANEIGTDWAMLYEEYALVLERMGDKAKADEIYLLGIARKSQPLEHLKNRHRDFQKRMMLVRPGAAPPIPASSVTTAPRKRAVLGVTRVAAPTPTLGEVFTAPTTAARRPNGTMAVFVDPEGTAAEATEGNAWDALEPRKVRVKENTRLATKMAGTKLPKQSRHPVPSRPVAPKIVPYRDPEPEQDGDGAEEAVQAKVVKKAAKFVPFRDGKEDMPPPKAALPAKTPAAKFVPFRDEEDYAAGIGAMAAKSIPPVTPRFTAYRDETAGDATAGMLPVPESVMRQKTAKAPSEAEALRRDPFKNYDETEKLS